MKQFGSLTLLLIASLGIVSAAIPDEVIRVISNQIWEGDGNRIKGNDVQYNVNGNRLFTKVSEARLKEKTYASFIALFNKYHKEVGIKETCSAACVNERNAFLDAIMTTIPMRRLHFWLEGYGLAPLLVSDFKKKLEQYFFTPYSRSGGTLDSSGFEHVFLGEIKNKAVIGIHNWVRVYLEEKANNLKYLGHTNICPNEVLRFSFDWFGYRKKVSTMFIRTSPEVEVALYTLCLLTRPGTNCPIRLNGINQEITVHTMAGQPLTIGSAFPVC